MLKSTTLQQIFNQFSVKCTEAKITRFQKQHSQKQSLKALEKDLNKEFFSTLPGLKQLIRDWAKCGARQHDCWQRQVSVTFLQTLSSQTSLVPWARVMASLRWAAQCYCRITERLIETNDSNNGTLSPQAGFAVGLISVAVVARTSHHTDPLIGRPSFKWPAWDSLTCNM